MWKNYYQSRDKSPEGKRGENKDSVPEQDGMKNNCPEKETRKTLLRGNGKSAGNKL
jgi:hypothetical protein